MNHSDTFAESGPILIQTLVNGEWRDYGRCDEEKAGRFIGYGDNAKWYRALDAETGEAIPFTDPVPANISGVIPDVPQVIVMVWKCIPTRDWFLIMATGDGAQLTWESDSPYNVGDKIVLTFGD